MTDKSSLIQFPCEFPIKIIGISSDNFVRDITSIILKHYAETKLENITYKNSGQGSFTAITTLIYCHDQQTLDALYMELTAYPGIKMVL